ncbi:hypothetical protein CBL_13575 [Carabus blaptoides fortunei]
MSVCARDFGLHDPEEFGLSPDFALMTSMSSAGMELWEDDKGDLLGRRVLEMATMRTTLRPMLSVIILTNLWVHMGRKIKLYLLRDKKNLQYSVARVPNISLRIPILLDRN